MKLKLIMAFLATIFVTSYALSETTISKGQIELRTIDFSKAQCKRTMRASDDSQFAYAATCRIFDETIDTRNDVQALTKFKQPNFVKDGYRIYIKTLDYGYEIGFFEDQGTPYEVPNKTSAAQGLEALDAWSDYLKSRVITTAVITRGTN